MRTEAPGIDLFKVPAWMRRRCIKLAGLKETSSGQAAFRAVLGRLLPGALAPHERSPVEFGTKTGDASKFVVFVSENRGYDLDGVTSLASLLGLEFRIEGSYFGCSTRIVVVFREKP